MQLINLTIDRIIIHQVFQRDVDGNKVPPIQSHEFTNFDQNAMDQFKIRVKDALGDGSKAVQMEIVDQGTNDLPYLVDQLVDMEEDAFAVSSYDIAKKLTDAQHKRAIPGGIVVVFLGKQGAPLRKFLGIIKAEIHSGYEKERNSITNEISLKFVEELLLTPGTRLYKTAGFFKKAIQNESSESLNDKWTVMVSDYQISKTDGKAAAQYFYSDFLGCGYPQTSARTTKQFHEHATSFIMALSKTESKKSDLLNALALYLKADNSPTINTAEFAARYFDTDTQDDFSTFMEEAGLPTASFTKDIAHIKSKLEIRRVRFRSNLKITASPEIFKDLVSIEPMDGGLDASGNPLEWTKVVIKDRIVQQE